MMPSRILREGILTSEGINALSERAELCYRKLQSVADDYGRYTSHPMLIKAACYPLRPAVTTAEIQSWLEECARQALISMYVIDGKKFLLIHKFDQRLRLKKERFPAPPADLCQTPARIVPSCDGQVPVIQDNGNHSPRCPPVLVLDSDLDSDLDLVSEKKTKIRTPAANAARSRLNGLSELFEYFWKAYPNHVARVRAEKAFVRVNPDAALVDFMLAAIQRQKTERQWLDGFIPHPATWLNEERWKDEPIPAVKPKPVVDKWWISEAATLAKGQDLGLSARAGESMGDFRGRIAEELQRVADHVH